MTRSVTITELVKALIKAQLEMESAKKDSINPHFKSKYADLTAVKEAIKEPLAKNGFAYTQLIEPGETGGELYVVTLLLHTSGEWLESRMPLWADKRNMQGMGSAISYARRYSLAAITGLTQDDDDGNAAVGDPNKQAPLGGDFKPKVGNPVSNISPVKVVGGNENAKRIDEPSQTPPRNDEDFAAVGDFDTHGAKRTGIYCNKCNAELVPKFNKGTEFYLCPNGKDARDKHLWMLAAESEKYLEKMNKPYVK